MKQTSIVPGILLALLYSLIAAADSALEVTDPWIREAPPGANVLAAYMVIANQDIQAATITAIASPDFERIEMHRTLVEDGVARMVPVESLQIAAAGRVVLEPGGIHVMLYNPRRLLREGDSVALDIQLSGAACIRVNVPVAKMNAGDDDDHQHHHH
ncbi:MAG: copper chaperone PCu(A)C [Halobacteria archaeon]|nr:copper chaperone PCu(A)C [Halobacteria archaeon]